MFFDYNETRKFTIALAIALNSLSHNNEHLLVHEHDTL